MSDGTSTSLHSTIQARLMKKIERDPVRGCWLFTGALVGGGYGQIGTTKPKRELAHRVSYQIHCGEIPDGMMVLHRCDVRRCVNPAHLYLGSNQDNKKDAVSKGRHSHGEKHYLAKLTVPQVCEIRRLILAKVPARKIAAQFGVSYWTVQSIRRGKSWRSIPGFTPPPPGWKQADVCQQQTAV